MEQDEWLTQLHAALPQDDDNDFSGEASRDGETRSVIEPSRQASDSSAQSPAVLTYMSAEDLNLLRCHSEFHALSPLTPMEWIYDKAKKELDVDKSNLSDLENTTRSLQLQLKADDAENARLRLREKEWDEEQAAYDRRFSRLSRLAGASRPSRESESDDRQQFIDFTVGQGDSPMRSIDAVVRETDESENRVSASGELFLETADDVESINSPYIPELGDEMDSRIEGEELQEEGEDVEDEEDEEDAQATSPSTPAPKRDPPKKNPKAPTTLPAVVLNAQGNAWVPMDGLSLSARQFLEKANKTMNSRKQAAEYKRFKKYPSYTGAYCIQCQVIARTRGACPLNNALTACQTCVDNNRPCAKLILLNGEQTLCWLPWPTVQGQPAASWSEKGYWCRLE